MNSEANSTASGYVSGGAPRVDVPLWKLSDDEREQALALGIERARRPQPHSATPPAKMPDSSPFSPVALEAAAAKAERTAARAALVAKWAPFTFAASALDPERSDWERKLLAVIDSENHQHGRGKAFRTTFTGKDALAAGAPESDLTANMAVLDRAAVLDLYEHGWALTEAAQIERKARAAAIVRERSGGHTPLEDSYFDFARDFAALRPPVALIPGLIESGTAVQIIAEPNEGKTFLALAWACDLAAAGRDVVYVVGDDSTYQFNRRVLGWCAAHDAQPEEIFARLHLITRAAQFGSKDDMDAVAALAIRTAASMIVFDTQHQCSDGLVENSNDDSRVITAALVRLTKLDPGPAVVLVHHSGDGQTGRGAKSIHGFVSTVLAVKTTERDGKTFLEVKATKQKNMRRGGPVLVPFGEVEISAELRAGVISEADRLTMVARTRRDPFDMPGGDRAGAISDIRRYCVLWALADSATPLAVTTIAKRVREAAKPMLGAKGLLTAKGLLPKGFTDQAVSALLMDMAEAPKGKTEGCVDGTASTAKTPYYEATNSGKEELATLAALIGLASDNSDNPGFTA
jgi:hypothetical protein